MSSVNLTLTEAEFITQQCPKPSDDVLVQVINGSLTGIVTYIKLDNGMYQTISRYEEEIWVFPTSKAVKGVTKSEQRLNFGRISNIQMKRMAKWVLWNEIKRGLALGTLSSSLKCLSLYFKWVQSSDITASQGLTAVTSKSYVEFVSTLTIKRKTGFKHLSHITKRQRLRALESLYRYCIAFDFVKEHPWLDSTANQMSGYLRENRIGPQTKPKTLIIPNEVLSLLCQFTLGYFNRADELLVLRDELDELVSTFKNRTWRSKKKAEYLQSIDNEFDTLIEFGDALNLLRDSCIFWLLLTTGMRIHEVLSIKRGAYRSETIDDTTYYYIQSVSEKTHTGKAEWIAPEIAINAIDILGRINAPLQEQLQKDLLVARARNDYLEVERLEDTSNHICLSKQSGVNIIAQITVRQSLNKLCKQAGSDWGISPHQFRRTFANYVVHSELGDLRALKDHFKHWSITMTALYALNDDLDAELFEELLREKYLIEEEIKQDWFELDTPITGGDMAQKIMQIREDAELIKVFGSHAAMVKAFTASIPIRSVGIGWCTNDDECKCGKPDSCESGIVDKRHAPYWTGMLVQQMKLTRLCINDIGEAGIENVKKGMERCEKVLTALGFDVKAMKQEINQKIAQGEDIEVVNV